MTKDRIYYTHAASSLTTSLAMILIGVALVSRETHVALAAIGIQCISAILLGIYIYFDARKKFSA